MASSLLGQRLRRYKGLLALISSLVLFIIVVIFIRTYVDTLLVQRETFGRAKTLNYVEMFERFGTSDQQLRDDVYAHVLMFKQGGRLATPFGPAWDYPAVTTPSMIAPLDATIDAYAREDWPAFQARYAEFDQAYGELVQGRQRILLGAQYVSLGIMFLGFLGVLGLLFFRLGKADDEADAVRRENEHILASTKEGVFLIDAQYQIGEQQSKALKELFGQDKQVSGDFLDFIKPLITAEELERTKKFLNLVFGGRVKPKLMGDLNPLHNVELRVKRKAAGSIQRVLNFDFSRDEQADQVSELLVTVSDITNEAVLREELDAIQSVQEQRLNLLKGVLHVEPSELNQFFYKARTAYTQINSHLEEGDSDPAANASKLDKIARIAHALKGDASALRLDLFAATLHQFEDTIDELRKDNFIDGQRLVKLVVQLKNMIAELELASSLTNQFGTQALNAASGAEESRSVVMHEHVPLADGFKQKLQNLAQAVAEREDKQVEMSIRGVHHLEEFPELASSIYDCAVQLVRNAVVHGVELPAKRTANDKPETAKLLVSIDRTAKEIVLTVADDGQGLQYDKIRSKAVEKGFLSSEAAAKADDRELLKTIFVHGFSSSDVAGEDAGRGVGLDAVREIVDSLHGRISVGTAPGKYSRFVVKIGVHETL